VESAKETSEQAEIMARYADCSHQLAVLDSRA
jgi:hypothetical protein